MLGTFIMVWSRETEDFSGRTGITIQESFTKVSYKVKGSLWVRLTDIDIEDNGGRIYEKAKEKRYTQVDRYTKVQFEGT